MSQTLSSVCKLFFSVFNSIGVIRDITIISGFMNIFQLQTNLVINIIKLPSVYFIFPTVNIRDNILICIIFFIFVR